MSTTPGSTPRWGGAALPAEVVTDRRFHSYSSVPWQQERLEMKETPDTRNSRLWTGLPARLPVELPQRSSVERSLHPLYLDLGSMIRRLYL